MYERLPARHKKSIIDIACHKHKALDRKMLSIYNIDRIYFLFTIYK